MRVTIFIALAIFGSFAGIKPSRPKQQAHVQRVVAQARPVATPNEQTDINVVEWLVRTNPPDLEARLNPYLQRTAEVAKQAPARKAAAVAATEKASDDRLIRQRERQHREHMKRLDDIKRQQQRIEWLLLQKHGRRA